MSSTQKVKSAGRFGSRYGIGIRRRVIKVEEKQHQQGVCPQCGFTRVNRKASGIFSCKKCGIVFTGGAYYPQTLTGSIVAKMVNQKSFLPNMAELLKVNEEPADQTAEKGEA